MLWFNAEKDLGALKTADGDRIEMSGAAFATGELPEGRCAGKEVEFRLISGRDGPETVDIVFVPEANPRRARRRHSR